MQYSGEEMLETADFNGTLRLDEENLYMIVDPDKRMIDFGENNNIEGCGMILDYSEAYSLYLMLGKGLLFLSHQK